QRAAWPSFGNPRTWGDDAHSHSIIGRNPLTAKVCPCRSRAVGAPQLAGWVAMIYSASARTVGGIGKAKALRNAGLPALLLAHARFVINAQPHPPACLAHRGRD